MMVIHVDDGIMIGDGPTYDKSRQRMFKRLRLKNVFFDTFDFLKRKVARMEDGSIEVSFGACVQRIKPIYVPKERRRLPEAPVTETERTSLRSLLGELAWPAHEGFPEYCYDVSDMQQRVNEATVSSLVRANSVLKRMTERARRWLCAFRVAMRPAAWSSA